MHTVGSVENRGTDEVPFGFVYFVDDPDARVGYSVETKEMGGQTLRFLNTWPGVNYWHASNAQMRAARDMLVLRFRNAITQ